MQQRCGRRGKERRDALAQQVLQDRRATLVGHVQHLHASHLSKQFASQVRCRTRPGGREVNTVSLLLGLGHVLSQSLDTSPFVDDQHVGEMHRTRHRCQVFERVIGQFEQVWRNRQRPDRAEQQNAAIGGALRHLLVRDVAASTGLVVHYHGLADVLAQLLGDQARGHVGRATGGKTHHKGDRFARREVLRLPHACTCQGSHGQHQLAQGVSNVYKFFHRSECIALHSRARRAAASGRQRLACKVVLAKECLQRSAKPVDRWA